MAPTFAARPEMVANHNDLAQFYNNFFVYYNAQQVGGKRPFGRLRPLAQGVHSPGQAR